MTIDEFLHARLDEEETMKLSFPEDSFEYSICANHISLMRFVLAWHDSWPVLVQTQPIFEMGSTLDGNSFAMKMQSQLNWFTQEEYRKKFGDEPPTSPIMSVWIQQYRHHPDFQEEWLIK